MNHIMFNIILLSNNYNIYTNLHYKCHYLDLLKMFNTKRMTLILCVIPAHQVFVNYTFIKN